MKNSTLLKDKLERVKAGLELGMCYMAAVNLGKFEHLENGVLAGIIAVDDIKKEVEKLLRRLDDQIKSS